MARSGTTRPGGRTALTRARVHAAVRELLEGADGAGLHMSQIAARSGVNAATLYRRWGSSDALILDVVVDDLSDRSPIATTGDLRTDLIAYADQVQAGLARPSGLHFLRAVAAVTTTPEGETAAREIAQGRLDQLATLVDGHDALHATDIVDGIIAPITYRRLLAPDLPFRQHEIARLVDTLLDGAAARRARRS